MRKNLLILLASATLAGAACGSAPAPAPKTIVATKRVDPATAGSLSGRVTLAGPRPELERLHISADPICLQALGSDARSDAVLIDATGGVQNAFVYIQDPLVEYAFDVPKTVIALDQHGCHYSPRIFGVRVGQTVDITNSDATLHNVHALPMINAEFNVGQPVQGSHLMQVFNAPEVMVRFKCDVHPWMTAYGGVMPHPFFAVTNADGTFEIPGLPPGEYALAVWHEKFGVTTRTVNVGEHQAQTANVTLTAAK